MSMNSSSLNNSLLHSNFSYSLCIMSSPSVFIYTTINIIRMYIVLPLCIFILNHVLRQGKKNLSPSSGTINHSDYFTYHLVIMELMDGSGYTLCFIGIYIKDINIVFYGVLVMFFVWYGQMYFHVLTCVERYLAVVHPITYLGLRSENAIRIRNCIIGCVWLLCFGGVGLIFIKNVVFPAFLLIFSLATISFCSLSVLYVLIRPGPGEHAENKDKVVSSTQKAFYLIATILAVLLLRITWGVFYFAMYLGQENYACITIVSSSWITIPSSLVLPLLFLHRAGKLEWCKR